MWNKNIRVGFSKVINLIDLSIEASVCFRTFGQWEIRVSGWHRSLGRKVGIGDFTP